MRFNPKRYAVVGLVVAGLATLAALILLILQRSFTLPVQISLALILIGLALFLLLNPQRAREIITGRQARYGSNILVALVAFLGILIAVNYLVNSHTLRWDLTEDKTHTLAPETLQVLANLPSPVQVNAFFTAGYPSESTATLLDSFKFNSNGKFDFKFINPDAEPVLAQQAGITQDGSLVLRMDNRSEILTFPSEQSIASALIRLANPGERVIYFITGHGEFDSLSSAESGLSQLASALSAKNYTLKTLNLPANPAIPADALSIIIAGPRQNFSDSEIQVLQTYQDAGGSLIIWSTPKILTDIGDSPEHLAGFLSNAWGLQLGLDMIVDLNIDPPIIAYGATYGQHPITEQISTLATLFPRARSVTTPGSPPNITLTPLVSTAENSWAETDITSLEGNQVSPDEGKDLLGPVTLAFAGENTLSGARLVVVGNAEFITNAYYTQYGNLNLALNMVDWASAQDNLLNLTPRPATTRSLITPTVTTQNLLLLGSVILLPGLVLLIGVIVWVRQRQRG